MTLVALFGQSPDLALLGCVLGILLIYIEFNRPGLVLPGACGLLLLLLSVAGLMRHLLNFTAICCLVASAAALFWGLRHRTSWLLGIAAGIGIVAGCRNMLRPAYGPPIHWPTAIVAGLFLGPGTFLLTAVARRARVNKGLD